jgi:hypothetical protein
MSAVAAGTRKRAGPRMGYEPRTGANRRDPLGGTGRFEDMGASAIVQQVSAPGARMSPTTRRKARARRTMSRPEGQTGFVLRRHVAGGHRKAFQPIRWDVKARCTIGTDLWLSEESVRRSSGGVGAPFEEDMLR